MEPAQANRMPTLIGASKLDRLFHEVAGLDLDKEDVRRLNEFLKQKVHDLLLAGQATASTNGRDIIQPRDLPITKGLQETLQEFKGLEMEPELEPILKQLAPVPRLDLDLSLETEGKLPEIVGALTLALARTLKILDPELKNPATLEWGKAFAIFNQLL